MDILVSRLRRKLEPLDAARSATPATLAGLCLIVTRYPGTGARSALRRSLRLRLVLVFWLLALAMAAIFIVGTPSALDKGWRVAVALLLADYMDRLAAEVGSPPDLERRPAR